MGHATDLTRIYRTRARRVAVRGTQLRITSAQLRRSASRRGLAPRLIRD